MALHVTPRQAGAPGMGFADLIERAAPFPAEKRERIAQAIHEDYLAQRVKAGDFNADKLSHKPWADLNEFYQDSNRRNADDIPRKLKLMGLDWGEHDARPGATVVESFEAHEMRRLVEEAAQAEHDRWLAERRQQGWVYAERENVDRQESPAMLPWAQLPEAQKVKDRASIEGIPKYLRAGGYVVYAPPPPSTQATR